MNPAVLVGRYGKLPRIRLGLLGNCSRKPLPLGRFRPINRVKPQGSVSGPLPQVRQPQVAERPKPFQELQKIGGLLIFELKMGM